MSAAAALCVVAVALRYGLQMLDDGYYYLQIAWNLSRGLGFTFDGTSPTNGFHPLWQVMIVPVFWLVSDKLAAAFVVTAIQALLFSASGFVMYRLVSALSRSAAAGTMAAAFWLFNLWFWSKGALSGMETGLLMFVYGLCLLSLARLFEGRGRLAATGVLLALACASRIDSMALVAAAFAVLLLKKRAKAAVAVSAPAAAFVAAYLALNMVFAGGALPISGYLKSVTGRALAARFVASGDPAIIRHALANLVELFSLGGRLPSAAALALAACGAVLLAALIARLRTPGREIAAIQTGCAVLMLTYYSAMYDSLLGAYTYYWYPVIYGFLAVAWTVWAALPRRWVRAASASCVFAGLAAFDLAYGADRMQSYSFVVPWGERPDARGVEFLDGLGEGAVIGSWDAGYVGYFCTRRVVNLDGLVNSYRFQRILREDGFAAYLDSAGIDYLANVDYFHGTKEMIRDGLGWPQVFGDSCEFPRPVSVFSLSPAERGYASHGVRAFFVFERPGGS